MAKKLKENGAAPGAAPETLEEALVAIQNHQVTNQDLVNQLNESKTIIAELKGQLKEALEVKVSNSKKPTIKISGVTYEVNHGAHGVGDALALSKNEEAAKKILANKGQNALTKI